jgi:hypothetical protein
MTSWSSGPGALPPEAADTQKDQVEEGLADQDNPVADDVPKGIEDAKEDARRSGADPDEGPGVI